MEYFFSFSINNYKIIAIFWNVFLAVAPCITVYFVANSVGKKKWGKLGLGDKTSFVLLFLFWLFMFPNTAYLFTLVRHLVNYCDVFDKFRVCQDGTTWVVMFFFTYALIGLPTFYYALKKMSDVFKKMFNRISGLALPVVVIPLTTIALMFGLLERFNSWDILMNPTSLINTTIGYFTDITLFFNFLVFTISLYLIYYGFDYFLWQILKKK